MKRNRNDFCVRYELYRIIRIFHNDRRCDTAIRPVSVCCVPFNLTSVKTSKMYRKKTFVRHQTFVPFRLTKPIRAEEINK